MTKRFCPRCAAPLAHPAPVVCAACGYEQYLNARPTASVILLDGDRFLALKRRREPGAGRWCLPGGFCDGHEHPARAAVREAREELGVAVELHEFVGMYVGEYRFQEETLPVLDCFWFVSIVDGDLAVDPQEATGYGWLALADPPPMAFLTMDQALREAHRMRSGAR